MLKKNFKNQHIISPMINLILIISLIITFMGTNSAYAASEDWIEVKPTKEGRQLWNKNSLSKEEKEIINISTKYLKLKKNTPNILEENIYLMKIDCLTNSYKDIATNGSVNIDPKWQDTKGDTLINEVILDSCQSIKN